MSNRLRLEGTWPEPVVIRKGWARAESRPWNAVVPMAHLRLVRGGGSSFIGDCVTTLRDVGADAVLSPPLPRSAQRTWCEAKFEHLADLALLRRALERIPPPGHLVMEGTDDDVEEALRIDAAAFEDFWQFDRRAMHEAMAATPRSILHVVRTSTGGVAGFAVSGAGASIAYVQRLAVDPKWQRQGIGRSLVRSSARWAKRMGSRVVMLNTQADNEGAIALYESEGFTTLDEPLAVLKSAG